jgi:hypothetical protein
MAQNTTPGYPRTASILALVGGVLILLTGILLIAVSIAVLPHLSFTNLNPPPQISRANLPGLVSDIVGVMGAVGLVCGVIVLVSAVALLNNSSQPRTLGVLILVFSVLSFLGLGGFVVGAILGIIGGILALTWKPKTL